ncbi:hypothetical protein FM036_19200 [Nostoc sp. HG1]|nr:hypothetical protein [Nostoc sp. HG1]MCL6749606.1 hypothetical protein [Nostoc sp. CCCryo 231-06]
MTKPADVSTKKLISLAPNNWVRWVTQIPDIVAGEILNSEFQWISRESDVLIRVSSPQHGEFLLLNELQLRYQSNMPRRMRAFVQEIMRWDVSVLRESPWYHEILREGEARGKASGELRGILSAIEINLELKFGDRGLQLMPQINLIQDLERLKTILRNVITANTIEELQQIL